MNAMLRNRLTAIVVALAAVLMAVCLPTVARAADLRRPDNSRYLVYTVAGRVLGLGVVAQDDDTDYYCIETGSLASYQIDEVREIASTDDARRLAWLIDHYRSGTDQLTYAAIAVLVHDHYDLNQALWAPHRESIVRTHAGILERADALWREAAAHASSGAKITQRYAQGLRQGVVEAIVTNTAGSPIAGVPYTVTLDGPAHFENGKNSIAGVSGAQAIAHSWQATGAGEVTASISYDRPTLEQIVSGQDFVRFGGMKQVRGSAISFTVRKDFTPSLDTRVSAKIVDAGQSVVDEVTSGVRGADSHWPQGLKLAATGWYFDKLSPGALNEGASVQPGESAAAFLKRLAQAGHKPSAYGAASFTGPGQMVKVKATTKPGGSEAYKAPAAGGFGTWVWAFERGTLSEQAREYVLADAVMPFLEVAETNAHRARLSVRSSVTEHSASVGSELSDTITVSGFPDDHGSFAGSKAFGFGPDRAHVQVSVWWSGDANDAANDEQYRPSTADVPKEDEHHRRIGTWNYAAANGTFRIGAGVPDAHGKPVNIRGEAHGWYVFVWQFAGDDRVMPAASAYDDAWERTRVEEFAHPKAPVITTQVDHDKVKVNEPFRDVARVVGDVKEGSYVEFGAYEAVAKRVKPGANAKLLDGDRVKLNHTSGDQKVPSSQVRSAKPGFVYWKATVFSPKGDVLATHELGAEGEVVEVVEDSKPTQPAPNQPNPSPGPGNPAPDKPAADRPAALAKTGSSVVAFAGVGIVAALVALLMVAAIRRRM
jgi:hypothetical protein